MTYHELKTKNYHYHLDLYLKKTKLDISSTPPGFLRRIPLQLANDMFILAMDSIRKVSDKETLLRLKYICEYFLNEKSKKIIALENDIEIMINKEFCIKQLNQIKLLLKNLN